MSEFPSFAELYTMEEPFGEKQGFLSSVTPEVSIFRSEPLRFIMQREKLSPVFVENTVVDPSGEKTGSISSFSFPERFLRSEPSLFMVKICLYCPGLSTNTIRSPDGEYLASGMSV